MFEVTEKKWLNDQVVAMSVSAPEIAKRAKAGQFIVFRVDEKGERVPLTIAGTDAEKGTVEIIFQVVGASTIKLSRLEKGEYISDFVGPLGKPTELAGIKKAVVVGGGVGCAIAYPQMKRLKELGAKVDAVVGFRTEELVILEAEMERASDRLFLATDDGSYKIHGFVTNVLKELIDKGEQYDVVIAIGPIPMMRAVAALTKEYGIKTIVSLNPIMVDGTGMCGCCRVTVDGKIRFACVDGPDFDGHLVDYDELIKRNGIYKHQEQQAKDHVCRLEKVLNG